MIYAFISRFFRIKESGTKISTELISGTVTFMTMSYIIFVNPNILAAAGIPKEAAIIATCLAAGTASLIMGIFTNYPFALAPGMGLNAFLAFTVVLEMKIPWQVAMGIVFFEGFIILILVLTNLRVLVMDAIPINLKRAVGVGIGLFIAFIGLQSSGMVVKSPATLVTFGTFTKPVIISAAGLIITVVFMAWSVRGSILIGIIATTCFAILGGITTMPASIVAVPNASHFVTFGAAFNPTVLSSIIYLSVVVVTFTFLLTDFFDTLGTVVAVSSEAGFLDNEGKVPGIKGVLVVDSIAAMLGGAFGCSSVTTYVESAAGVAEGGRTGLTSVITAFLFFLAILFWPLVSIVPAVATAPALIVVGYIMMQVVRDITFNEISETFPAFLIILTIPLTYSISKGIGYGFISYVIIKVLSGRHRDVHPILYGVSVLFALDFYFSGLH